MDTKNFLHLMKALSYYGETGINGPKNNPVILDFFDKSNNDWVFDDDVPWCAAFLNAVLVECNLPNTGKLTARSFLDIGVKTHTPVMGDIVVFWRESPKSWKGHVGIFIREKDGQIYTLGGNQNNQVNIKPFPKSQVLGYRSLFIK